MGSFARTATWVIGTLVVLFLLLSGAGYFFLTSHSNQHAETILEQHSGAIVSLYARLLVGYIAAGILAALLLHPFVRGWKAVLATLGLVVLSLIYTLTSETQLIYGPVQTMYCTVHDGIPAWIRGLYRPWLIQVLFAAFALGSLLRWTRAIPSKIKFVALGVGGIAATVTAFGLPTGASPSDHALPNVLMITTDSLRADHLSCNGYSRETSPHIDALAARGTNFANCLVPTASTHESWISMLSSTEPRENGLRHMFPSKKKVNAIEKGQTFLPALLSEHEYQTAVIGGWCGATFKLFDVGYDHVDVSDTQNHLALIAEAAFTNHLVMAPFLDNPLGRMLVPELERVSFARSAGAITSRARRYMRTAQRAERPFFLTLVYHVTHLPYSASYPYYTKFTDPKYRGDNRFRINFSIDDMIQKGFDHDLGEEDKQHIIDLYDGCVMEFDAQVGALVEALRESGELDNTIVCVWADHGDDLYEHGTTLGHGITLFGGDHTNRPPAVFAGPNVSARRVDELVRSIDLAPTLLSWMGLGQDRPGSWRGHDLSGDIPDLTALLETSYLLYRQPVPDLRPGEIVKGFPKFDRATFFDPEFDYNLVLRDELEDMVIETKCFAVREGSWKFISVPGEAGRIFRLFDLANDPQCRSDRMAQEPAVASRLKALLPEHAR